MPVKLKDRINIAFRRIVYPKGSTALKWKEITLLYFSLMSVAMTITSLFPFLPAMVKHFGKTEEETGYYAGLIASAMFFGRFISSYFWGNLADKFGRRPVVIISLFLLSASMFAFGFSTSVTMAVLTRFSVGFVNGFLGTAKAVMSELCDHTNQSLGMSILTSSYSTGLIFGPAIGGFLSEVGRKNPRLFPKGSLFEKFPFLLPCLVNSVLLMVSMIIIYIWLPETLIRKKKRDDSTEKKVDCEEISTAIDSALLKKNDIAMETNNETEIQKNVNERNGGSEISQKEGVVCIGAKQDINYTKSKKEVKETHGNLDEEVDVNITNDTSTIQNTYDGLFVANKKGESNESKHSKDSNHDTKCTNSKAIVCSSCSTNEMEKNPCTRESKSNETNEESLGERGEREEHADECHTTGMQDNDEPMRRERTSVGNSENCDRCKTCNEKNKREMPSSTATNTRTSSACITDSKKLKTSKVELVMKPACWSCWAKKKDSNLWRILRNGNAVLSVAVYSIFSIYVIGSEELFNLWGATEKRLGGLGFSTDDLGTTNLVIGLITILMQPTVLPKLERKMGALLNFQVWVIVAIFAIITQPTLRIFNNRPIVLWSVLIINMGVLRMSTSGAFLSCFLLVNNSVKRDLLCSINGLAVSVCSLFRAIAPSIGGSLFAWSISSGYKIGFPFNINLAFIVFGLHILVAVCLSCIISESLNNPKGIEQRSHDKLLESKT